MIIQERLLRLLADGELHSGSELAAELAVTRSAVWKHIKRLESLDLEVNAQAGQGYRLAAPIELLDEQRVFDFLGEQAAALCGRPHVLWVAGSTSDELLRQLPVEPGEARVCLAEYQSAGRGRRGRQWFAPAGCGICLSVAWQFTTSPASLSCLGLAVGVGVLRALLRSGVAGAQLKWPNDIVINGRKLAGILIDVQGEAGGPLHVVAGVGVNYQMSRQVEQAIIESSGLAPANLVDSVPGDSVGRNVAAGLLIEEICAVLADFADEGFEPLAAEWNAADCLAGQELRVSADGGKLRGVARGITDDGRLKLDIGGKLHLLVTGDVSIRPGS
jgi:BirA family biotin operon repressor/biotin-[acetyl-CoA-carboxylase] ligase